MYILGKQHKMHNKNFFIDTTDKPRVCLYANLFNKGNTLPGVENYQYGAILTDKAIRMRFSITIKSKNAICDKSKIFFNEIETYTGKKMQYFRLDNAKKYQLLVFYFEKKGII